MANLKDIRNRIKSVTSIQQVTKAMKMVAAAKMRRAQENMEKVLVAKHDGSKQCDKKSGTSLDVMVKDLGEIKVYDQFKAQDDLMRIQVCGAPTGMHNVYEISKSDLKKATQVGFTLWKGSKKK